MVRSLVTSRISWALVALASLAVLLPVGLGESQAAFVAQSTNPNQTFAAAICAVGRYR